MWISTLSVSPAPPYVPLVMSERGRYLVELARPEAGWQDVQALASRARAAAAELTRTGSAVRFLRAIYLPEDDSCALLFEGPSAEAVRAAGRLAGTEVVRATAAESGDPG